MRRHHIFSIVARCCYALIALPYPLSAKEIARNLQFSQYNRQNEHASHRASLPLSQAAPFRRTLEGNELVDRQKLFSPVANKADNYTFISNSRGDGFDLIASKRLLAEEMAETPEANSFQPTCGQTLLSRQDVQDLVVAAARAEGISVGFALAIAFVESGFDQQRNSKKGARGAMQLMPATAAQFGVDDICDPQENITGAMKYLRVLQDEFKNPLLVAAAYNAGEARIYQYGGIPPFAETVSYVAKVINYQLGLDGKRVGRGGRQLQPPISTPMYDQPAAGVIGIHKDRKFTGGVMHF
ncbi:lytic transglycosylase domain-containing protein [Neorhizobium sp. NCHU2750]|uniref:lytic transglycosylase domain-containing protein n=1 Tax=Neorhizobium sp. NCHU2750 TaxID=1825976 RepID=UPI000E740EF6|nr:lytic transglycosylase [Neorhizobium sp. NCHU2750]